MPDVVKEESVKMIGGSRDGQTLVLSPTWCTGQWLVQRLVLPVSYGEECYVRDEGTSTFRHLYGRSSSVDHPQ